MNTTTIFVISGGLGTSGVQMVRTALAQFPVNNTTVTAIPQVRTPAHLHEIIAQVQAANGFIVHTLVDEPLRRDLTALAASHGIVEVDLMGPLLERLSSHLGCAPLGKPGLYRKMREQDFKRIEAIEFAVAHDDGKRAAELDQAEIVLTGVSRVGKTPLSMYLSTMGWKVANVPLVMGIEPPAELFQIERERVVGLTIEPGQLVAFRVRRGSHLGLASGAAYSAPQGLWDELEFAHSVFRRGRFAVMDMTDKPVEESAEEIIARVRATVLV
ncbi:MAG: pyruvate, water dikinase regulatory protein [Anaerolineae bacterium]